MACELATETGIRANRRGSQGCVKGHPAACTTPSTLVSSHQMPTVRINNGMPKRIHRNSQRGTDASPPDESSAIAAKRSTHQASVIAAIKAPTVWSPDPKVRSQGRKIALLMVGGSERTNTAMQMTPIARFLVSRVLSVSPATSVSNDATSERYPAPTRPAKKRKPNSQPAGIAAKTLGKVVKISGGPEVGSSPSANTAGMTARPATRPEMVSAATVNTAALASFSFAPRYEPYATMYVPPSDSENIAWPIAETITFAFKSCKRNLRMYQRTPAIAPGSVSERQTSRSSVTRSSGIITLLTRSMPLRNPFTRTSAHAPTTAAVHTAWSRKERKTNPWSGGSTALASNGMPNDDTSAPTA